MTRALNPQSQIRSWSRPPDCKIIETMLQAEATILLGSHFFGNLVGLTNLCPFPPVKLQWVHEGRLFLGWTQGVLAYHAQV
jgi:hypothetical protein